MARPLHRPRNVAGPEVVDVDRVDLRVAGAAGRVEDRLAVFRKLEIRDAFARVAHALRFAAVEAHDEDLVSRAAGTTAAATSARGRSRSRGARRVTVRQERDEASV